MHLTRPSTALLNELQSVTVAMPAPRDLVRDALVCWRHERVPVVIAVMGEPTAGKSTLSSEITALVDYELACWHTARQEPGDESETAFVSFEALRDAAYETDLVPRSHGAGMRTPRDWARINELSIDVLVQAIRGGGVIVYETPALALRGDRPVELLARRVGALASLTYGLVAIWLAPTPALIERGVRARERFHEAPTDKLATLAEMDVRVDTGPHGAARIAGADPPALRAFYGDLVPILYTAQQSGVSNPHFDAVVHTSDDFFRPAVRSRYIAECYAPHLLQHVFALPQESISICENRTTSQVVLHQSALDSHDYVERLRTERALAPLASTVAIAEP